MLKQLAVYSLLVSVSLTATYAWAGTKVAGDLILFDSGEIVFPDGSVQSRAQVQGPAGPQGPTGPPGPAGAASQLTIGTVTAGTQAAASLTGSAPNQVLHLTLPQGAGSCADAKEVLAGEASAYVTSQGVSVVNRTDYFRDTSGKFLGWNTIIYTTAAGSSPSLTLGICTDYEANGRQTACKGYPSGWTYDYTYVYGNSNNLRSRTRTTKDSSGLLQDITVTEYDAAGNVEKETKSNLFGLLDVLTYAHTYGPSGKSTRATVSHTNGFTGHNVIYQYSKICP